MLKTLVYIDVLQDVLDVSTTKISPGHYSNLESLNTTLSNIHREGGKTIHSITVMPYMEATKPQESAGEKKKVLVTIIYDSEPQTGPLVYKT